MEKDQLFTKKKDSEQFSTATKVRVEGNHDTGVIQLGCLSQHKNQLIMEKSYAKMLQ